MNVKPQLQIRSFEPSDLPFVWDLHNKALTAIGANLGNGPWDDDLKDIGSAYLNAGGEFLVGIINNQIVAMGALKKISDSMAEIKRMRVNPEFQRQGFGQMMLTMLEQQARNLGFTELQLDTQVSQTAARKLYEKNGYQEYKLDMIEGRECVFYKKLIN